MVKVHTSTIHLPYAWDLVAGAVFQKYPNPFSPHVLSSDVISRFVDPATGRLHTTRLFLKEGKVPRWARSLLSSSESYIIEYSVVDASRRAMVTVTRNLNHTKLMVIEETQRIAEREPGVSTSLRSEARFASPLSWQLMRSKMEGFGLLRFRESAQRSLKGLTHVLERLRAYRLSRSELRLAVGSPGCD